MDALARNSILNTSFQLSEVPVVASIEATIDGIEDFNWMFDESTNSIIFITAPTTGSNIEISYSVYADCH